MLAEFMKKQNEKKDKSLPNFGMNLDSDKDN
jgi:hypothetical protein